MAYPENYNYWLKFCLKNQHQKCAGCKAEHNSIGFRDSTGRFVEISEPVTAAIIEDAQDVGLRIYDINLKVDVTNDLSIVFEPKAYCQDCYPVGMPYNH